MAEHGGAKLNWMSILDLPGERIPLSDGNININQLAPRYAEFPAWPRPF
jgi:hypothetical protein